MLNSFPGLEKEILESSEYQIGGVLNYNIVKTSSATNKKFNCTQITYNLAFSNNSKSFTDAYNDIMGAFEALCAEFVNQMGDKDKIRIIIFHDSLQRPISTPFLNKHFVNSYNLMTNFEHVAQSYKTVKLNENSNFKVDVVIARLPSGSGKKRLHLKKVQKTYIKKRDRLNLNMKNTEMYCLLKPSIKNVINNDNYCALRAIIMAKAFLDRANQLKSRYSIDNLKKPNSPALNKLVIKHAKKLKLKNEPVGIAQIRKIQLYKEFKDHQITVYEDNILKDKKCRPCFIGPYKQNHIYLVYANNHYNVIKKIKSFLNVRYYCHYCKEGYNNANDHKCKATCS